jgi:5-methylcytosine-specific restriction enzyme A
MPRRTPSPCATPGCPHLTTTARCPDHTTLHQARQDRRYHQAPHRRVYKTAAWQRLRKRLLQDHPWCQSPGCHQPATDVDHIVPLADGGEPFDETNLQTLCKRHHSQKTQREVFDRKGPSGFRGPSA